MRRRAQSWLFIANAPVAIFTAAACFAGLFGLAAPEPNPARWIAIGSPVLLAAWLAVSEYLFDAGFVNAALTLTDLPVVGLALLFIAALHQ